MAQIEVFSGSHGIGKTTAIISRVNELLDEEKEVIYMNEAARDCELPLDDLEAFHWMLAKSRQQMALAKMAKSMGVHVVMDRCPLDYYVYALVRGHVSVIRERHLAMELMGIDVLHFLRIEGRDHMFVSDGFRDMDVEFRRKVDVATEQVLASMALPDVVKVLNLPGEGVKEAA